jgi:hypothetical protein
MGVNVDHKKAIFGTFGQLIYLSLCFESSAYTALQRVELSGNFSKKVIVVASGGVDP